MVAAENLGRLRVEAGRWGLSWTLAGDCVRMLERQSQAGKGEQERGVGGGGAWHCISPLTLCPRLHPACTRHPSPSRDFIITGNEAALKKATAADTAAAEGASPADVKGDAGND